MNLRQRIESIVFAGLKPHDPRNPSQPPSDTWFQRFRARIDRFITGGPAPNDPLYLTNRTWSQKIRAWSLIAVPLVVVGGGVVLLLTNATTTRQVKPVAELSPAEIAARVLPNLHDIKVESNRSLEVVEVGIVREGSLRIAGQVRNRTDHEIERADIRCDLTDPSGTQLSSVSLTVEKIPASGTKKFEFPLQPTSAQAVLVREIATR